ncbi:sulfatase [Acidobacteriota bacterium]
MTRKSLIQLNLLLFFVCLAAGCKGRPAQIEPANVLIIVIDCLRPDHVGANGYERPTTPNLDALAADSVNFTQAYAQAIWTHPSVPTILTGLYPSEHGLLDVEKDERGRAVGPALSPSVETLAERLKAAGFSTALVGEQAHLSVNFRLNQGFDYYHYRADHAANIQRRFLKWLGKRQIPFCYEWRQLRTDLRTGAVVLSEDDRQSMMARYDEELLGVDYWMGTLFAKLKDLNLWDDLMIVVIADHGEEFLEHGGICHESGPWDELLAVPLIIKPPASWHAPIGEQVDSLVELRDLTPTILEACGIPQDRDSRSLCPWLQGRSRKGDNRPFVAAETMEYIVIRTRKLKALFPRKGDKVVLYDLKQDPGETTNVVAQRREDLSRMKAYLTQWQERIRAVNPVYREIDRETADKLKALDYLN